ncbi:MAG: ankyrin repeat domain-containing protein [Oligoflexia bacterium]|nr:ankyrin repeat domain-containing protein [Oligoflexia bacterium]
MNEQWNKKKKIFNLFNIIFFVLINFHNQTGLAAEEQRVSYLFIKEKPLSDSNDGHMYFVLKNYEKYTEGMADYLKQIESDGDVLIDALRTSRTIRCLLHLLPMRTINNIVAAGVDLKSMSCPFGNDRGKSLNQILINRLSKGVYSDIYYLLYNIIAEDDCEIVKTYFTVHPEHLTVSLGNWNEFVRYPSIYAVKTPIQLAIDRGASCSFKTILGLKPDLLSIPNPLDNGFTPLHYACKYERFEILESILEKLSTLSPQQKDAVLNASGTNGKKAIDIAFDMQSLPAINLLLLHGVQINLRDDRLLRSLSMSARLGDKNILNNFFNIPYIKSLLDRDISMREQLCRKIAVSLRPPKNIGLMYSVNQEKWFDFFGGDATQITYNQEFQKSIFSGLSIIDQVGEDSFDQVIDNLSQRRKIIATMLGHSPENNFGRERLPGTDRSASFTPMSGKYGKYKEYICIDVNEMAKRRNEQSPLPCAGSNIIGYSMIYGTIGNQKIGLTAIDNNPYWNHTDCENLPVIKDHLRQLFREVMNKQEYSRTFPSDPSRISRLDNKVAEIFWWLSQSMLYYRGSAAITDMLRNIIYQYHGYNAGKWKQDVCGDCYALSTPWIDEFQKLYLMIKEPTTEEDNLSGSGQNDLPDYCQSLSLQRPSSSPSSS